MGKKGPTNGEVNNASPVTDSSPSQDSHGDKKTVETNNASGAAAADDDSKDKAKLFDINDFFLSDTLLSLTGGVSSFTLKC